MSLQRCLLDVRTRFRDELASYCEDVSADGVGIPCSIPKWMSKFLLASFHHIPTSGGEYRVPKFYLLYKVHKEHLRIPHCKVAIIPRPVAVREL